MLKWSLILISLLVLLPLSWFLYPGERFLLIPGTQVYRSAQLATDSLEEKIQRHGIRSLINLMGIKREDAWYPAQRQLLNEKGLVYRDYGLDEFVLPGRAEIVQILHDLDALPKPLMVHCYRGVDRTGLVSMLRLLQLGEVSLEQAGREVALPRGAFFPDSVGKQFYRQYRDWLADKGREHKKAVFLDFVRNHYLDDNLAVDVDLNRINQTSLDKLDGESLRVTASRPLSFHGWGHDPQVAGPLAGIAIVRGGQLLGNAQMGLETAALADWHRNPAMSHSGWRLDLLPGTLEPGCAPVHLRLSRRDGRQFESETMLELCVD